MGESSSHQQFLSGANAVYIAQLQQKWRQNPLSIDADFARWFEQLDSMTNGSGDAASHSDDDTRPSWGLDSSRVIDADMGAGEPLSPSTHSSDIRAATLDSIKAIMLIRAYRIRGHLQEIGRAHV